MTGRAWKRGDAEPADRPAVVDTDGYTWAWGEEELWHRRVITRHGTFATYGPEGYDWEDLFDESDSLREATEDEADTVQVILKTAPACTP